MKYTLLFIATLLSLSVSGCTGSDDDKSGPGDIGTRSNEEVLTALGFNLNTSPPVTGTGETVTGTINPLGNLVSNLFTQYEIFQVGADISTLGKHFVVEQDISGTAMSDLSHYHTAETGVGADWMSLPKKSVAGDIDGDGKDEIVTAVFRGSDNMIIIKYVGPDGSIQTKTHGPYDFMSNFGGSWGTTREWLHDDYFMRDFTAGDFDNDGKSDFAISCMTGVLILDNELNVIGSFEVEEKTPDGRMVRVEAGDLNGDSYEDLVVVNGRRIFGLGEYYIFKGGPEGLGIALNASPNDSAVSNGSLIGDTIEYSSGEVAIADYNGDGLNEIILAGTRQEIGQDDDVGFTYAYHQTCISVWDPYNENTGNFVSTYPIPDSGFPIMNSVSVAHPRNFYIPRVVAGKFDGGSKDMFNVMDMIFYVNESDEITVFEDGIYATHDVNGSHLMAYDLAVAGDVTGNGCDDLVYMTFSLLPWANVLGSHVRDNIIDRFVIWGKTADDSFAKIQDITISSSNQYPTLALANVDNDSLVVKYDRHEMEFSEPEILAVLASPPYTSNPSMDIGDSSTSFSITSGTEISAGVTNGFNVGVTVGYEVGIGMLSGGRSVTVENSFAWGFGSETGTSLNYGYAAAAGTDMVIVTAIPIDVYVYEVLSGPDQYIIGGFYTINIPREPLEKFVEVQSYNQMVNESHRIPDELLVHTIGNPHSYYSYEEMEELKDTSTEGFFYTGTAKPVA